MQGFSGESSAVLPFFHAVVHFDHIVPSHGPVGEGSAVCGTKVKWCQLALPLQLHVFIKVFALVVMLTISDVPASPLLPCERAQPCLLCCCLQPPSVAFIKLILCTRPFSVCALYSEERPRCFPCRRLCASHWSSGSYLSFALLG